MSLGPGSTLGPFKIQSLIGKGGMGEVFSALDTRLDRKVALKILPADFGTDADRLRRFQSEAKKLASINHPNILVIHEVGSDGIPYLVSELLEGRTLREELSGSGASSASNASVAERNSCSLPLRRALDYALQIAHGLAAAHTRGIIHRDLKPENIFITKDSRVKILDFGLAKNNPLAGTGSARPAPSDPRDSRSSSVGREDAPTILQSTVGGLILGTPAYMSPEQIRGEPADHRSDIFAFGCVLYEMLGGRSAFRRPTAVQTLNAILTDSPKELPAGELPPPLEALLYRSLEKDPSQRFQTAADLAFALETLHGHSTRMLARRGPPLSQTPFWRVAAVLGAIVLLLSAGIFAWRSSPRFSAPAANVTLRLSVPPPEGKPITDMAFSPDGRWLALTLSVTGKKRMLAIRSLASEEFRIIPDLPDAMNPFWSPDSQSIGFYDGQALNVVALQGGRAREIRKARGGGAAWAKDGTILFTEFWGTPIYRVAAEGGPVTPVTTLRTAEGEGAHLWPTLLPDERHFFFVVRSTEPERSDVWVQDRQSGERHRAFSADSLVGCLAPDLVVFVRSGALLLQHFNLPNFNLLGSPEVLADPVGYVTADNHALAAVSPAGVLCFIAEAQRPRQLTWFDRSGSVLGTLGAPAPTRDFRLSPDSSSLAISRWDARAGSWNLWRMYLQDASEARLSFSRNAMTPTWSPEGSRIFFSSDKLILYDLYKLTADQSQPEQILYKTETDDKDVLDCSPDGNLLLISRRTAKTRHDIWVLPVQQPEQARSLLASEADETEARFSPDGRWLAFCSDVSGRYEIYVQPFPGPGPRIPVSRGEGGFPAWSRDGKELFFIVRETSLYSVAYTVDGAGAIRFDPPKHLFDISEAARNKLSSYDISPDGRRFLFAVEVPTPKSENLTFLLNAIPRATGK